MRILERAGLHGRITLTTVDPDWLDTNRRGLDVLTPPDWAIRDQVQGDNVVTTAGLFPIAASLVWAGIQDQAAQMGVTSPSFLTPLYGAVGNGAGTPAKSDTAMFSELARQVVGAGAASPATPTIDALVTWLFYFPVPSVAWTVTEAGVFANATSAAGSGTLLDHYAFPSSLPVSTSDSLILQLSLQVAGS